MLCTLFFTFLFSPAAAVAVAAACRWKREEKRRECLGDPNVVQQMFLPFSSLLLLLADGKEKRREENVWEIRT